ncbi:MAG: hypothetical protein R2765_07940 [Ferruginibacter sp.]
MNFNPLLFYKLIIIKIFCYSPASSSALVPSPKIKKANPSSLKTVSKLREGKFSKEESGPAKTKSLNAQLDDSSRITTVTKYFIRHVIISPPLLIPHRQQNRPVIWKPNATSCYYKAHASYTADTLQVGDQQRYR